MKAEAGGVYSPLVRSTQEMMLSAVASISCETVKKMDTCGWDGVGWDGVPSWIADR